MLGQPVEGQYLGVTCGWQYSGQLEGPVTYPTHRNISLYNPENGNPNATWDSWAEQLAQAGVDFVCPNLTGSTPNTGDPPSDMAPLLAAIKRRGLADRIKFAAFDDNAASWCAQWNQANGRGFGYAEAIDLSDPANWAYIYDYNIKIFFQTIPDENRFKVDGRPVVIIWTASSTFVGNAQGNLSQAMLYVRQKCQADFGFDPYIIGNADFISNDSTCANPGVLDATHKWFGPPSTNFTLSTFKATRTGVAVPSFGVDNDMPANHGLVFDDALTNTVGAGAQVTLCEGFTDYEEDCAMFRVRNLAPDASALTYDQTAYDYPNQRLNILRKHSKNPVPTTLRFEAEGSDTFGGAAGGNGKTNYYRNGNIAIEATSDLAGGHNVGSMQAGEWFEWRDVPLNGAPQFQVRIATSSAGRTAHLEIDGVAKPAQTLPNTGGAQIWATYDFGAYGSFTGTHTVRVVFDNGGVNFNWWQLVGSTPVTPAAFKVNRALSRTATASSSAAAYPAANVNDGNTNTRWQATNNANNAWIQVDLGATTSLTGVTLRWESAYASAYKIQVSPNGTTWTDVFSTTAGDGGVDNISFTASARYVRMQGVTRGTIYGYSLWEFEIFGSGGSGAVPGATTGLAATGGNKQVTLNWTATSGATSYNVKWATASGGPYTTIARATSNSYTNTELSNGVNYYYVVSAVNAQGEGANSAQAGAAPDLPAPTSPSATSDNGRIILNWAASAGAARYNIKRATTSGGPYTTVATANSNTYTNTGLVNGTTYYYVISAASLDGESANSPQVSGTPAISIPSAPTRLTAMAGASQAALSWTASADAASYRVKRSTTNSGPYTTIASPTGTSYTNTGLAAGTTYYYVISAVNSAGESTNSSQVSVPPAGGANLALSRPVTASASADSTVAENAVDGNGATRWSSGHSDNQWIYVDLGSVKDLGGVVLRWESAYATSYKVQVSNNASSWTDVYSTTAGDGGVDQISFAASGRYVRMLGVQRATIYGYSLWEFEIYGAPESLPVVSVTATDAVAQKGTADEGAFTFTRTGSTAAGLPVAFTVSAAAGQALLGTDYSLAPAPSTITIPAGQSSAQLKVTAIDRTTPMGSLPVTVSIDTGSGYSAGSAATAVVQILDSSINQWKIGQFGGVAAAQSAPAQDAADADGDGESNLWEYALGHQPLVASDGAIPVSMIEDVNGADYLTYSFIRPKPAPSGITYVVETNPGLSGTWDPTAALLSGYPLDLANGTEQLKYRGAAPINGQKSGFIRLRISRP